MAQHIAESLWLSGVRASYFFFSPEAQPQARFREELNGKPKAYRTVLRQSRKNILDEHSS
jgi:hypothetical protein